MHVAYSVAEMDAALQLDSQIHEYRSSEMGEFALQPWWGLPATLTGLALQEATAVVVHHSNLDNYGVDGLWVILQKKTEIFNYFTWGHIKQHTYLCFLRTEVIEIRVIVVCIRIISVRQAPFFTK